MAGLAKSASVAHISPTPEYRAIDRFQLKTVSTMAKETFTFQAEVGKLLDIVARSLYSHKEIFLRELVSNASDACDRMRYLSLSDPEGTKGEGGGTFRIVVAPDKKADTLTISDNGVGMNRQDLADLLGTIAKSGTKAFIDQIAADKEKSGDVNLIGQFGVGFYSAFMVADRVEVVTRKAGESKAWRWSSDGKGAFEIEEATRDARGTDVILHLAKGEKEFLDPARIRHVVVTYADHIDIPVVLKDGDKEDTLNTASALWLRDKKSVTKDQYKEFYHHVAHAFDEPFLTLHNKVEGVVGYSNLLFVPGHRPFDLFQPDRKAKVKLYVKRVFITDDCADLLPPYLRFLRGVVDSEDISLNISREMLQHDPKLLKIRSGLTKRVLGELKKKAEADAEGYATFWENFGPVLKEGIYEDQANRDAILAIARFRTSAGDTPASLDDYVGRMKEGQDAIFYIAAENPTAALASPQLEGFKAKGVEVLLLTDPVDEFWVEALGTYKDKPFKSATRAGAALDAIAAKDGDGEKEDEKKADAPGIEPLIAHFKTALKDAVKDVRASHRLTDSACCLVSDDGDIDIHLERLLRQHRQIDAAKAVPRILELNPTHPLIRRLAAKAEKGGEDLSDAAFLLLDQARIVEGEAVADAQAFARRLATTMEKGLGV